MCVCVCVCVCICVCAHRDGGEQVGQREFCHCFLRGSGLLKKVVCEPLLLKIGEQK